MLCTINAQREPQLHVLVVKRAEVHRQQRDVPVVGEDNNAHRRRKSVPRNVVHRRDAGRDSNAPHNTSRPSEINGRCSPSPRKSTGARRTPCRRPSRCVWRTPTRSPRPSARSLPPRRAPAAEHRVAEDAGATRHHRVPASTSAREGLGVRRRGNVRLCASDHATALARSSARRIARTASLSFAPPVVPRGLYRLSVTWENAAADVRRRPRGGVVVASSRVSAREGRPRRSSSGGEVSTHRPATAACRSNLARSRITSTHPPGASTNDDVE